jgi:hypothetical protein
MASGTATPVTVADLLRTVYLPSMRKQFSSKSVLLQVLERRTETVAEGLSISFPRLKNTGQGYGWSTIGNLPAGGHADVGRSNWNYKRQYAALKLSGALMDASRAATSADAQALKIMTTAKMTGIRRRANFLLYGDGTGVLATPSAASSATSFTVANARGLERQMLIDVLLASNGTVAAGVDGAECAVNKATGVVTLTSGSLADFATVNASPTLYKVYEHGSRNDVVFGLDAAVSNANPASGFFGSVDRTLATNEDWKGNVLDNPAGVGGTPRAITFRLMQDALDLVESNSDGTVDLIICGFKVWQILADILTDQKRYVGSDNKLNGWMRAHDFAGTPVVRDEHCPQDQMFFLDKSSFRILQNDPGDWWSPDGTMFDRVPGQEAVQIIWRHPWQLSCDAPAANAVIKDLSTT